MEKGTEVLLKDGRIVFLKNVSSNTVKLLVNEGSSVVLEAINGKNYFDISISDIEKVLIPEKMAV